MSVANVFDYQYLSFDAKVELLYDLYSEIKAAIKIADKTEYQRWEAGGFIVDENIASMYPNLKEVWETLEDSDNESED